jgi:hypothetical protein
VLVSCYTREKQSLNNRKMRKIILISAITLFYLSPCSGFELLVLGDSRSGSGNRNFQKTEEIIVDAIEYTKKNYDTLVGIVMTGDNVSSARNAGEWERWREANDRAFNYPVYPCIGNHDDEPDDCPWWFPLCESKRYYNWNYYQTFKVERWWSVDIEGLHLVALDSNLEGFNLFSLDRNSLEALQYIWFVNELEKNKEKTIIVMWHEPAYGSHSWFGKGHGSNRFMRKRYISLCERYGVKMIICGHNHRYERVTMNGITHITAAGGGAPLVPTSLLPGDRVEGSEITISAYHWCVVSIEDNSINVDVIEHESHKILDSFEITN